MSDVLASTSDLNPNEMVWDELDHKVKAKKPVRHLWEFHFFPVKGTVGSSGVRVSL